MWGDVLDSVKKPYKQNQFIFAFQFVLTQLKRSAISHEKCRHQYDETWSSHHIFHEHLTEVIVEHPFQG